MKTTLIITAILENILLGVIGMQVINCLNPPHLTLLLIGWDLYIIIKMGNTNINK
jgi:hypothetical protein